MMRRLARDLPVAVGGVSITSWRPGFSKGRDLPGGSGQEKRLQT